MIAFLYFWSFSVIKHFALITWKHSTLNIYKRNKISQRDIKFEINWNNRYNRSFCLFQTRQSCPCFSLAFFLCAAVLLQITPVFQAGSSQGKQLGPTVLVGDSSTLLDLHKKRDENKYLEHPVSSRYDGVVYALMQGGKGEEYMLLYLKKCVVLAHTYIFYSVHSHSHFAWLMHYTADIWPICSGL